MHRLEDTIIYEEGVEREEISFCAVHLFNLRTRPIRIFQLRTNFMRHVDRNIDQMIRGS